MKCREIYRIEREDVGNGVRRNVEIRQRLLWRMRISSLGSTRKRRTPDVSKYEPSDSDSHRNKFKENKKSKHWIKSKRSLFQNSIKNPVVDFVNLSRNEQIADRSSYGKCARYHYFKLYSKSNTTVLGCCF